MISLGVRWDIGANPSLFISYSTAHFCFAEACKEDLLYTRHKKPSIPSLPKGTQTVLTCWFSGFLSLAGNLEVYKRSWFKPLLHEEDGQPQRKLSTESVTQLAGSQALSATAKTDFPWTYVIIMAHGKYQSMPFIAQCNGEYSSFDLLQTDEKCRNMILFLSLLILHSNHFKVNTFQISILLYIHYCTKWYDC